jgi:DNA polymerase elongation subunit (family B)
VRDHLKKVASGEVPFEKFVRIVELSDDPEKYEQKSGHVMVALRHKMKKGDRVRFVHAIRGGKFSNSKAKVRETCEDAKVAEDLIQKRKARQEARSSATAAATNAANATGPTSANAFSKTVTAAAAATATHKDKSPDKSGSSSSSGKESKTEEKSKDKDDEDLDLDREYYLRHHYAGALSSLMSVLHVDTDKMIDEAVAIVQGKRNGQTLGDFFAAMAQQGKKRRLEEGDSAVQPPPRIRAAPTAGATVQSSLSTTNGVLAVFGRASAPVPPCAPASKRKKR